jgi:hypothetical protein
MSALDKPIAYDTGEGWELRWDCADFCGDSEEYIADWPFVDDRGGSGDDLAKVGFVLM